MSIITISRGSYSRGKEIAEKVARELDYKCIARETLLEASEQFNIPENDLVRAIRSAPSIIDRFVYGKEKYIAYIQSALLRHVQKDNVVYHGLAGHFLLPDISHVLKVRIISDINDRVELEMARENIGRKVALRILNKEDQERRKWSKYLYGIDTWDPSLYDLVLNIKNLIVDDAVNIICHTVGLKHFQTTPQSQKTLDDLLLACEVRATLIDLRPDIEASVNNGIVTIKTRAPLSQEEQWVKQMKKTAGTVPGVKELRVHINPPTPYS